MHGLFGLDTLHHIARQIAAYDMEDRVGGRGVGGSQRNLNLVWKCTSLTHTRNEKVVVPREPEQHIHIYICYEHRSIQIPSNMRTKPCRCKLSAVVLFTIDKRTYIFLRIFYFIFFTFFDSGTRPKWIETPFVRWLKCNLNRIESDLFYKATRHQFVPSFLHSFVS